MTDVVGRERGERALVPSGRSLVPFRRGRPLRRLHLRAGPRTAGAWRSGARIVLALGCFAAALAVLLVPASLYRSEATLVLSGEGVGTGASLESARILLAYLHSENAAADLASDLDLPGLLAPPTLDPVSRLIAPAMDAGLGTLADHLQSRLRTELDERSGHVRLSFDAHEASQAQAAIGRLMAGAEGLVNRLGDAARSRRIVAAAERLAKAESDFSETLSSRASLQRATSLLDPRIEAERDAVFADDLRSESARLAIDRARLAALTPHSPRLAAITERQRAIDTAAAGAGAAADDRTGTIAAIATDDRLKLSRTLAAASLEAAHRRMEAALDAERAERIYLSVIAEPSLPDRPMLLPRLWQVVAALALLLSTALLLRKRRAVR